MLILFCFEGTSKVWAVDQEEEKRDLVIVKYVLLLVPDFVPLSTCGNSPVGLPLGCVSAAGMGERSVWDLHPYLSPEMRLHCVSALAVSWTPETGGIFWAGRGWEHDIELSCWRREAASVAMPLPNDPNEVFLPSEGVVFTQPGQGLTAGSWSQ